jgi:O-antigen/teichoic acid export membrane protein
MANTFVITGLGYFFWLVVARYFKDDPAVSLGNALISAMTLLTLISRLGLDTSLVRFLPKSDKQKEMINSCFAINIVVSIIAAAIFILVIGFWFKDLSFIRDNAFFAVSFILFTVVLTISTTMESVFIFKRRADYILSKNTIITLLKIAILLALVLILHFHTFAVVSAGGLATGIVAVIYLFIFIPRLQKGYRPMFNIDVPILRSLWKYSAGNYFAGLFAALPALVLPLIVLNRLGVSTNKPAEFSFAWMFAGLIFVIPGAVAQSLFAEGSHFENDLKRLTYRSYKFTAVLLVPTIIIILLLGKWLLFAFGKSYSENALPLLQVLVLSGIFIGINSVYYTILQVEKKMVELTVLNVSSALAVLIGSYLIMPTTGIIGVGYVWISMQAIVSIYIVSRMIARYKRRT